MTTVVIVTLNRPKFLERCLSCLTAQIAKPDQIIVVDASVDNDSLCVTQTFADVVYLRNDNGFGKMTASRNIALKTARGDIIAFLDDDSFADRLWLKEIVAAFADASIGAVGGRALNNQPDEQTTGLDEIGRLLPNGTHTGYFAADPKRMIDVDHIIGCNMAFRREVLARLGGFREDYPGISGLREDTDMSIRVKKLGFRVLFNPAAIVEHVGAPQTIGRRFDPRYNFYSVRNHTVMLLRNFGLTNSMLWRYIAWAYSQSLIGLFRKVGSAIFNLIAVIFGSALGFLSGLRLVFNGGLDPVRCDAESQLIRRHLQEVEQSTKVKPNSSV